MARRGRGSRGRARIISAVNRTPTPQIEEPSDDEMPDAVPSGQATPKDDEDEEPEEEEIEEGDDDARTTPANDSEGPSRNATPGRIQSAVPQKRRAGRPPKNKSHDWDAPDEADAKDASDVGTPKRRGGWRGGRGFGGGRWGRPRGGPSRISQVPVDKEGNMVNVKDDEVELSDDSEGETKVDKLGRLKGDREYRVRVFTIQGKGDRLYMLSTEPARCIGFRDSYLFFQKHRNLFKIILPEEAKRDLIERTLIPHSYKGRAIGVVTARSVYREFGARIIIGGKKITDDYQAKAARSNGDIEGELAVPEDQLPGTGQGYDRNRYVAWHGASSVYHSGVPTVPMPNGKLVDGKKRKVHVTSANWMFEHAQEASRFNTSLATARRANLAGTYEPHTNLLHYPKIMQPTHCRWDQLPPPSSSSAPPSSAPSSPTSPSTHTPLPATLYTNLMTIDTVYTHPSRPLGLPGPDGPMLDVGPPGLNEVDEEVLACLPKECREAFEKAREEERAWREGWGEERRDGHRADVRITYTALP